MNRQRVILTIMDGFGIAADSPTNAISVANTPNLDTLFSSYPLTKLEASGKAVGLPEGQMGNSEVGHLNIGAGRVVYQDISRIDRDLETGTFFENEILRRAFETARKRGKRVHLIGLVSDGGVHSHLNHIRGLLELAGQMNHTDVTIHALMDGRDTPPDSGIRHIATLQGYMDELGCGEIGTIIGRYYAMDRDNRWERIQIAYDALVRGQGRMAPDGHVGMQTAYDAGETDEFIKPIILADTHRIADGDVMICFNFRADRMRQICHVFLDESFDHVNREEMGWSSFVTFTEYEEGLPVEIAFPPQRMEKLYGDILAEHGLKQLRIAETEKYAHVTFFFNGGEENRSDGEDRVLIPSPKVATYDLKPEMSAPAVTEKVVELLGQDELDVIVLNFANCDMVGHTGVMEAAVKAVETVDTCVGKVANAALANGWDMLLTADHGNAEKMVDETGGPHTAHTTNPVPLCLISGRFTGSKLAEGALRDIAPTLLYLLGLEQPAEMTGRCLIQSS